MRHFAITGIETSAMISRIFLGEAMRATPPSARICAGTRSSAITATAPAFSAIEACWALVTSIITPPFSISARPVFRRRLVGLPLFWDMCGLFSGYGVGLRLSGLRRSCSYFTARCGFAVPPRAVSCREEAAGLRPADSRGRLSPHEFGRSKRRSKSKASDRSVRPTRVVFVPRGLSFYELGEHLLGVD